MTVPTQAPAAESSPTALEFRAAGMVSDIACNGLTEDQAVEAISRGEQRVWVDVIARDREAARRLLQDRLGFHELAVEDSLSPDERPTLQEYDDHIFLVIPAVVGFQDGKDEFEEVGFFLKGNSLVTVAGRHVPQVDAIFARWIKRPKHVGDTPADLLHSIVDALVDAYFPAIDDAEDAVDELADIIFAGDTGQVANVLALKRRVLEIRRRLAPVRDILNTLLRRDMMLVPQETKRYFQDVYDHVLRIGEIADLNRDTLASLLDVHLSTVSNNLGAVMKKMTVLATMLMTMALISGIYGMNFEHMPELKWRYGYPFALALMFAAGGLILFLFRRFRWL